MGVLVLAIDGPVVLAVASEGASCRVRLPTIIAPKHDAQLAPAPAQVGGQGATFKLIPNLRSPQAASAFSP